MSSYFKFTTCFFINVENISPFPQESLIYILYMIIIHNMYYGFYIFFSIVPIHIYRQYAQSILLFFGSEWELRSSVWHFHAVSVSSALICCRISYFVSVAHIDSDLITAYCEILVSVSVLKLFNSLFLFHYSSTFVLNINLVLAPVLLLYYLLPINIFLAFQTPWWFLVFSICMQYSDYLMAVTYLR